MIPGHACLSFVFAALCSAAAVCAEPPRLVLGDPATEGLLVWCRNALEEAVKNPQRAGEDIESFESVLKHLESLPAKAALENPSFNADYQKITELHHAFVHRWGMEAMRQPGEAGAEVARKALERLRKRKASSQYMLFFFARLGDWKSYYAECRRNLELYNRHPEDLKVKPPIPPEFVLDREHDPETLLDMLAVYDMCRDYQQEPDPAEEERILLGMSRQFEKAGRLPYAVSSLSMIAEDRRSGNVKTEIERLTKLKAEAEKNQNPGPKQEL